MDRDARFGHAATVLAGKHVLVVDDESDWRGLLRSTLESCAAVVSEADTVDDALQRLKAETVDLIVSDIEMPGRSGYELLNAARRRNAEVLIVAWSAHHAVTSDTHSAGFDLCLSKPIQPTQFISELVALLRARDEFALLGRTQQPPSPLRR